VDRWPPKPAVDSTPAVEAATSGFGWKQAQVLDRVEGWREVEMAAEASTWKQNERTARLSAAATRRKTTEVIAIFNGQLYA